VLSGWYRVQQPHTHATATETAVSANTHYLCAGFRLQDDNFVATMTTSETMSFYADIILPKTWSKADRRARVVEVLAAMGLKHKQRTMVGGTLPGGLMLRGLSGGERKRLSIAAGILAAPSIVFLDEPTSGLDSFAALTVMGYLKRMARDNGHIVIASIHQPRSAIWSMFDKVRPDEHHRQPSNGSSSNSSLCAHSCGGPTASSTVIFFRSSCIKMLHPVVGSSSTHR
jgi:ATP-binding cassette subfamily G (WHITE) protein 2